MKFKSFLSRSTFHEFKAHLLHLPILLQKVSCRLMAVAGKLFTVDVHGRGLAERLGSWAWFTRKFLFDLMAGL